jgi:pimeloyl-ACP methyl ester carboxylesterase
MVVDVGPDVRLTVDVEDGDGRLPVLLLHGLRQQRRFWDPVVRRLRARPVAALDQRGHGDSDTPPSVDYSVSAFGADVIAVLDSLGWPRAVVVGHSWGASVGLSAAAQAPARLAAVALIDGGLWSPARLGPRDEVRARLTPPALGIPEADLWAGASAGDLAATWSDEVQSALTPTFIRSDDGTMRTRIGMERHMLVLDGLLDHDIVADLDATEAAGVPVWAAVCEPRTAGSDPAELAVGRGNCLIHRWAGAVHDVPLQWPSLVAGFVDTVVDSQEAR